LWKRCGLPVAVFVAAFAVRVLVASEGWGKVPLLRSPVVDGAEYVIRGAQVADGQFWPTKMEIHPPLYGWFVGGIFAVFGRATFWLYIAQAALGACTALLLWTWTRALAGPRAAAIAGALAAFAWPLVSHEAQVSAAGVTAFFVASALAASEWAARGRPSRALAPGVLVGLAALAHGLCLAFTLILLVPLLSRSRQGVLAATIGLVAAVVPPLSVCARNSALTDGAFALQSNIGLNMWIGNNEGANGYPNLVQGPPYEEPVARAWNAGALTTSEQDRYFRAELLRWIGAHPFRWLGLCGRKALATWSNADVDSSMDSGILRKALALDALAFVRWGWLAGLALPGAILLARRRDRRALLAAAAVAAFVPLVLLVTSARYRVPCVLLLVPAAAAALDAAWEHRRRLASRHALALAGLAAAGAALSYADFPAVPSDRYFPGDRMIGASWSALGDFDLAEDHLEAARRAAPGDPVPPLLLSRVHFITGANDRAVADLLHALDLHPTYLEALVQAGSLLPSLGKAREAEDRYLVAVAIAPRDSRFRGRYGEFLLANGRAGEALEPLREAVTMQPRSRTFRMNLGACYLVLQRVGEAEGEYRAILDEYPANGDAFLGLATCALQRGDSATARGWAEQAREVGHPGAEEFLSGLR
jgi:Tfp pilus assembly protein PilF